MILAEIVATDDLKKVYFQQKQLYDNLSQKNKKLYFINCYNLANKIKKKIDTKFCKNKKIIFFEPENYSDLNNFFLNKNFFLINNLSPKFYHFRIHFLLNKKNIYQVSLDNLGMISSYYTENWKTVQIKQKLHFLYLKKLSYIFYRIFIILGFIKSIDKLFLARKDIFKKYQKNLLKKTFFKKRYNEIVPVMNKEFKLSQKPKEKYLVYIDTNLNHGDIEMRNSYQKNKNLHLLTKKLNKYFKKMKKTFNKKVIICLHPSSDENLYKKIFRDFKVVKYETEKYLVDSFLILFHESSLVNLAIHLNKKIINIKCSELGSYIEERSKLFSRFYKIIIHDLDKNYSTNKNELLKNLTDNIKFNKKSLSKIYFTKKEAKNSFSLIQNEIDKQKKFN